MKSEHFLWFAGGIFVGWLVLPMVLKAFTQRSA
jgi:hypothetical protein